MPIFEYQCSCGNEFEKLIMNITKKTVIVCPKCKSQTTKKIMSKNTFRLKGYWSECGYEKTMQTDQDIIKAGPEKSIEKLQSRIQ